jgi:hypothetical protein
MACLWLVVVAMAPATAFAQDDDTDAVFGGDVNFISPMVLVGGAEYEFAFQVKNTTTLSETHRWIDTVEMTMPSPEYFIYENEIVAPDALHEGSWEYGTQENDDGTWGIVWLYFGAVSSEGWGDIEEGDSLEFGFKATVDAAATDGFPWRLVADTDENFTGIAYIGGGDDASDDDQDDDNAGDDDTGSGNYDSDDDKESLDTPTDKSSNSGCGC